MAALDTLGRTDEAESLHHRLVDAKERTLGPTDSSTLTAVNNLAWFKLRHERPGAAPFFERCVEGHADSTWMHHWGRLGRSLCRATETGDFNPSESVIQDLITLLGEDHDRIANGRDKIEEVRTRAVERD